MKIDPGNPLPSSLVFDDLRYESFDEMEAAACDVNRMPSGEGNSETAFNVFKNKFSQAHRR